MARIEVEIAKDTVYLPVPTIPIEGFTHEEIQGQPVVTNKAPFKNGHIPLFSCVAAEPNGNHDFITQSTLTRISSHHNRAYEIRIGEDTTIIWEDEYKNLFTKLNIKGNNCMNPGVYTSGVAPSGFMIYGMQDSESLVRCLAASDFLRSHNIPAEAILRVIEPSELVFAREKVSTQEFKRRLMKKIWDENAGEGETGPLGFSKVTRKDLPQVAKALANMMFVVTVRGMQVSERLADLSQVLKKEELLQMLGNAFRFVNLAEELKAKKDKKYKPQHFDINNKKDVRRYFRDYLPKKLAHNFAQMHKLGIVHFFPHTENISTVGSFIDLDSVRGEPLGLGDRPVTFEDTILDLINFRGSWLSRFPSPNDIIFYVFIRENFKNPQLNFLNIFLKSYLTERGINKVSELMAVWSLFDLSKVKDRIETARYFTDQVTNNPNIKLDVETKEVAIFLIKTTLEGVKGVHNIIRDLIRQLGLESDVAGNIIAINHLFGDFANSDLPPEILEYYLIKLEEQLGWKFIMEETVEEMIARFHEHDQQAARQAVKVALENISEDEDRNRVIENILDATSVKGFWDHKGRYVEFACEYVEAKFDELCSEQYKGVEEKYGEETASIIAQLFTCRYDDIFVNHPPQNLYDAIEPDTKARLEGLKEEFSVFPLRAWKSNIPLP